MQLMLSDLSQADAARVSAFVRLGSDKLKSAWSVGADGNVQLVLYAGESPATIPGTLDAAPYLVRVVDPPWPDLPDVHTLVRPLEFEAVIEAMAAAEAALKGAPVRRQPAAEAQPAPAQAPAPQATPAGDPPASLPDLQLRLKRWPQAAILREWRYGIRMASFMSARFITVRELAQLSNVSEEDCAQFVAALQAADMIRVRDAAPAPAPAPARPAPAAEAAASAPPAPEPPRPEAAARRGLLGRLRDKLGIGLRNA